jgi:hypothetical protein
MCMGPVAVLEEAVEAATVAFSIRVAEVEPVAGVLPA